MKGRIRPGERNTESSEVRLRKREEEDVCLSAGVEREMKRRKCP